MRHSGLRLRYGARNTGFLPNFEVGWVRTRGANRQTAQSAGIGALQTATDASWQAHMDATLRQSVAGRTRGSRLNAQETPSHGAASNFTLGSTHT